MNLEKRIQQYLKDGQVQDLWAFGFNEGDASLKALAAWKLLTPRERLLISKYNPFRRYRYHELHRLWLDSSLSIDVLAELSGLAPTTIKRHFNKLKDRKIN